ncbi:MAG: Hsp20/alpha crystallin family protein [Firmicutes bacterium]|nr:Hsp20/alpha crystallin family protein [Bacillota bacterium]
MTKLIPAINKRTNLVPSGFGSIFNMIDDFFTDDFPLSRSLSHDSFKVDIKDEEKNYLIEAEMPGAKKEEVQISYDEGLLTIAFNHEENTEEKDKNYIHRERRCTSMQRNIKLNNVDATGIKAKLKDGLLEITIPKKEQEDKSKKIEIE